LIRLRNSRAFLAAAAFLLLVAILEIFLRFGLGLGRPVLIAPDAACSYILKPDQDLTRFFAHTHINHYGMRSDEFTPAHNAKGFRLLFVGDSLTYGTSRIDQSQIFTEILHRDLPAIIHRPVEVLNASAGGWAIDNELSFVQSRGTFQSDVVVLVLNSGDLTQPRSTIQDVSPNLALHNFGSAAGELYARWLKPRLFPRHDSGENPFTDPGKTIRSNLSDLDRFQQLVSSQGARMAIVYLPFRGDIPGASAPSLAVLQSWTTAHHVPLLDLTSAESAHSARAITLDNGVHLNARGNLVVAQAIEKQWHNVVR
jgi:lysophospholipase L1-like esterase